MKLKHGAEEVGEGGGVCAFGLVVECNFLKRAIWLVAFVFFLHSPFPVFNKHVRSCLASRRSPIGHSTINRNARCLSAPSATSTQISPKSGGPAYWRSVDEARNRALLVAQAQVRREALPVGHGNHRHAVPKAPSHLKKQPGEDETRAEANDQPRAIAT